MNALPLSEDRRWREDVQRLIRLLDRLAEEKPQREREEAARLAAERHEREVVAGAELEHARGERERVARQEGEKAEADHVAAERNAAATPTPAPVEEEAQARARLVEAALAERRGEPVPESGAVADDPGCGPTRAAHAVADETPVDEPEEPERTNDNADHADARAGVTPPSLNRGGTLVDASVGHRLGEDKPARPGWRSTRVLVALAASALAVAGGSAAVFVAMRDGRDGVPKTETTTTDGAASGHPPATATELLPHVNATVRARCKATFAVYGREEADCNPKLRGISPNMTYYLFASRATLQEWFVDARVDARTKSNGSAFAWPERAYRSADGLRVGRVFAYADHRPKQGSVTVVWTDERSNVGGEAYVFAPFLVERLIQAWQRSIR